MDIHPWTKYEIARAQDEARLLRARAAMRALELREERPVEPNTPELTVSWLDRVLRRGLATEGAVGDPGA
jgi:hypothetical protein